MRELGNEDGELLKREFLAAAEEMGAEFRRVDLEERADGGWTLKGVMTKPTEFGLPVYIRFFVSRHADPQYFRHLGFYVLAHYVSSRKPKTLLPMLAPLVALWLIIIVFVIGSLTFQDSPSRFLQFGLLVAGLFLVVTLPLVKFARSRINDERRNIEVWNELLPRMGGIEEAMAFDNFCQAENERRPQIARFPVAASVIEQAARELGELPSESSAT